MKKLKIGIAVLLGTLTARIESLFQPRHAVALANSVGLFNENGIESLIVDPASSNLPFAALLAGRARLTDWRSLALRAALGLVLYAVVLILHGDLFGMSPLD